MKKKKPYYQTSLFLEKMKSLKHNPARQAKVVPIKPTFILLKEACEYVGMKADLFREVSRKHGLSVYAYGTKKVWFKVSELDEMIESFLIIKGGIK